MPKKLPDKLPIYIVTSCSAEIEANKAAIKYNSLKSNDSRRENFYEKWKNEKSRAEWD